jgi:hypothetical protein
MLAQGIKFALAPSLHSAVAPGSIPRPPCDVADFLLSSTAELTDVSETIK